MAPFITANKCVRVSCSMIDDEGKSASVRWFYTYSGSAPIPADMTALAGEAATQWEGEMLSQFHESWAGGVAVATDLTSDTSPEGTVPITGTGALTGGKLPASAAVVVSFETGRRYRGGHSRVYVPAGDSTKLVNDGTWDSGFSDNTATDLASTITGTTLGFWGGAGIITQVMSSFYDGFTNEPYGSPLKYRRKPTPRDTAVFYDVLNTVGKAAVGTQRRRVRL